MSVAQPCTSRLRYLAQLDPPTPAHLRTSSEEVSFLPMDAVGDDGSLDMTLTRPAQEVASGYTYAADGDLLLAKVTPCFENGKAAIVGAAIGGAAFATTEVYALRTYHKTDRRFLYYCLRSEIFRSYGIARLEGAGGLKRLSSRDLLDYPLWVPTRPEQRMIADFLDRETAKIDALIEKQNDLVALLQERRRVLAYRNVLGQTAAPDAADSWFGAPPAHWTVDKLGRHTSISNGSTPSRENLAYWTDGHFPWLNSSNANHDIVTESQEFVTTDALRDCHLPILHPGAVLVGITGQGKTRGMATLLGIKATINQHLAAVVPDGRYWDSRYLVMLVGTAHDELRRLSDEGGSTKGALTCADLYSFRVPRPPLPEQRSIVAHLSTETVKIDALIAKVGGHIALAKERRAALITAAVTGQIDFSEETG